MTTVLLPPPPILSTAAQSLQANEPTLTVLLSLVISLIAYTLTAQLVPFLSNDLVEKGLKGRDMLKVGFVRKEDESTEVREGEEGELPGRKWM